MDDREHKKPRKSRTKEDGFYKIILSQFSACFFIVLLIAVVVRLDSSQSFKEKYENAMRDDKSISQVWNSAKDVVASVMKPVDEMNTESTAPTENQTAEKEYTPTDSEAEKSEEETYEKGDGRTVSRVMSIFSDDKPITPPVHGKISSSFGYRTDPISGEKKLHGAVDIAVDAGTNVGAAWDGIVTKAGYDKTAGNYVWMVHKNGCETLYCHCSKLFVKKGDVIRAGETVAQSGSTGYSTGPHLHFGIRKNGEMIDPLEYLSSESGKV